MNESKEKQLVLVTGGGKRVGADIVRYFASRGFDILLHYHSSKEEALKLQEEVQEKYGVSVQLATGDLSQEEDVQKIFSVHSPDVVINNAARFAENDFDANMDANARAVSFVSQKAIARMRADKKKGVIFLVGDAFLASGGVYSEHLVAYTMSKVWVPHVVSELAAKYGKEGIRVLGILNGPIEPPPGAPEIAVKKIQSEINLPDTELSPWIGGWKVGEAIHALFQATAINGESVRVDGGRRWQTEREHS